MNFRTEFEIQFAFLLQNQYLSDVRRNKYQVWGLILLFSFSDLAQKMDEVLEKIKQNSTHTQER